MKRPAPRLLQQQALWQRPIWPTEHVKHLEDPLGHAPKSPSHVPLRQSRSHAMVPSFLANKNRPAYRVGPPEYHRVDLGRVPWMALWPSYGFPFWCRGRGRTLASAGVPSGVLLARISHTTKRIGAPNQRKVVVWQRLSSSRSAPMPTECSADLFGFAVVEGRDVVVAFDGGAISSDAGALLLGTADHAIKLTERFAACLHDARRPHLIEHEVGPCWQRVLGSRSVMRISMTTTSCATIR